MHIRLIGGGRNAQMLHGNNAHRNERPTVQCVQELTATRGTQNDE
jgi:hypothetical protein